MIIKLSRLRPNTRGPERHQNFGIETDVVKILVSMRYDMI